ncbi:MAG TPA: glucose 1-dehydrogenase [Candidatus Binatia bacterium]|jgi:3-oxoacyl-[acyl-carrier protein] reductase
MSAEKKLSGKVAIVTGASKGIGAGIAKEMAAEGASVVVNYSSSGKAADNVVAGIKKNGGTAVALHADMTKKSEIERLFSETIKAFGRIDILVNNAGVYEFVPLEAITEEHFHKHFNINVLGLLLASQQAAKYFGKEGGSIINISSLASTKAPPTTSVYSATKGAVDTLTKALANELGPRRIRVNAINPGVVITEGVHAAGIAGSDFEKQAVAQTPLGRTGLPADIAPAAVFLASSDASWLTGETLIISGGLN